MKKELKPGDVCYHKTNKYKKYVIVSINKGMFHGAGCTVNRINEHGIMESFLFYSHELMFKHK